MRLNFILEEFRGGDFLGSYILERSKFAGYHDTLPCRPNQETVIWFVCRCVLLGVHLSVGSLLVSKLCLFISGLKRMI